MTKEHSDDNQIICDCTGTTRAKILQLIARGDDSLERIESITGANTGCAGCESDLLDLLENTAKKNADI